jgi:hypothetical protein
MANVERAEERIVLKRGCKMRGGVILFSSEMEGRISLTGGEVGGSQGMVYV